MEQASQEGGLKECREHGYFRAEFCPVCGDEGRFLMNAEELDRLSRTMAGVLRHFPERFDLRMDSHGFVSLRDFVNAIGRKQRRYHWLRPHHIIAIIETDNKGRYEYRDGMIRATYAHSFEVDLDLPSGGTPDRLYYPTTKEEVDIVLEVGLKPSDRKMVHLSRGIGDAVNAGRVRTPEPIILEVDARGAADDGIVIKKAGKTVYLTTDVPPKYLSKLEVDLSEFPPDKPLKDKAVEEPEEEEDKPVQQELPPEE
ncbi:MAG: RNA 2'-phosphotransferase [Thermoplasmata archaeon]|jgi:putative RNA 2'-phosphotransferase|nr:RNA 2'-phosphotransferase [Thermoplasmata archaeon]